MTAQKFEKNEELAKILDMDSKVVVLANLSLQKGEELMKKAESNKRRQNYFATPAGCLLIAFVVASATGLVPKNQAKEFPTPFNVAFMIAGLAYAGGRLSDRRSAMREDLRSVAINNAIELHKARP